MAHCSPQLAYYDCKKLRKEIYFCNSFFKYDLFPSYQNVMKKKFKNTLGKSISINITLQLLKQKHIKHILFLLIGTI